VLDRISIAAASILLAPAGALAQCAMCGTALQGENDPIARGLFWSVLFLISLPYTIVGGVFIAFVVLSRRAAKRSARRAEVSLRVIPGGGRSLALDGKENRT